MSDKIFAVAVDGPSGAGKSTLAKAVAAELGIVYVDTGAIYRSIGCYMHDHQIDPHDAQAVAAALPQVRIQIRYGADGLQRMILNDEDVTDRIRLPEICGNVCFGGPKRNRLFMAASQSLYALYLGTQGAAPA